MVHKDVYKIFISHFPKESGKVEMWFPNGKNSVRVRMTDKRELVFTYNGPNDWFLETVNSFIERMMRKEK